MTNQAVLTTQLVTESNEQVEGSIIKASSRAERPLMNTVRQFGSEHPKVKQWIDEKFHDNATRSEYGWHLLTVCKNLEIQPEELLPLAENGPSKLFLRIKQYLTKLSNERKSRKASQMKCAISSFVNYHNESPTEFKLNVPIKIRATWERPIWTLKEWAQVLDQINYRYQPLFKIGVMSGFGRMELVYLNEHLSEVKSVSGVPEASYLEMPARKSNERFWKAILPTEEVKKLKEPLKTTRDTLIQQFNLTQQFNRATHRANMRVKGTGVHVIRSIFRTVGGNASVNEKILEQQMGHFDKYHYDRSHEDLPKRALALIPLWQYFREGPPVASASELEASRKQTTAAETRITELESQVQQLQEMRIMFADLAKKHPPKKPIKGVDIRMKIGRPDGQEKQPKPRTPKHIKRRKR